VGGVTVNLLLGMAIYIGILWTWGREYLPLEELRYGVHPSAVMAGQGVQEGDVILAVDGTVPRTVEEVAKAILIDGARTLTVARDGERVQLPLSADVSEQILERNERVLFAPRVPFFVDTIIPGGTAASSELRKGDRILEVDGRPAAYFNDFRTVMAEKKAQQVEVLVERDGQRVTVPMEVNEEGLVGIGNRPPSAYFSVAREEYGLLAAIPAGINYGLETLGGYVRSLRLLFTRSGASQIGGFGAIGGLFSPTWDWQVFWNMTAFLSIVLAFMNILPIPALDGSLAVSYCWRWSPASGDVPVMVRLGFSLSYGDWCPWWWAWPIRSSSTPCSNTPCSSSPFPSCWYRSCTDFLPGTGPPPWWW